MEYVVSSSSFPLLPLNGGSNNFKLWKYEIPSKLPYSYILEIAIVKEHFRDLTFDK